MCVGRENPHILNVQLVTQEENADWCHWQIFFLGYSLGSFDSFAHQSLVDYSVLAAGIFFCALQLQIHLHHRSHQEPALHPVFLQYKFEMVSDGKDNFLLFP